MVLRFEKHQYDTLLQRNEPNFVDNILASVKEIRPETRLPDDMLRHDIRTGIERARAHWLRSDAHVSEYVLIMFEIAPNFDQQSDIKRVLADTSMSPTERWERLFKPDMDPAWADADRADFYDERYWWPDGHDFADDAPKPEELTDEDWGAYAYSLAYMKQNPNAEVVPEPTREQLRQFTDAFRLQRSRNGG